MPIVDLTKTSGTIIMTFLPQTSHNILSLDRAVYSAFTPFNNQAANNWMFFPENVGKPLTIYSIAELVETACSKTVTMQCISVQRLQTFRRGKTHLDDGKSLSM